MRMETSTSHEGDASARLRLAATRHRKASRRGRPVVECRECAPTGRERLADLARGATQQNSGLVAALLRRRSEYWCTGALPGWCAATDSGASHRRARVGGNNCGRAGLQSQRSSVRSETIDAEGGLRVAITEKTIKVLWARARNRCAYPSCTVAATNELRDAQTGETFYTPGLEQAHIRSKSEDGPRYDPEYPQAKLDSYENLILLCGAHHTPVVDAEEGRAYTAKQLEKMKRDHEANHDRLEALEETVSRYLGEQYAVDDKVLFEQVELRGPSVESMFVDVPFTCRSDAPPSGLLRDIASKQPGDVDVDAHAEGQSVTGAAQALLHPDWTGNALLVGGPGQGKSTLLQFVCQFHRSRVLDRDGYTGKVQNLDLTEAAMRFPIRIDLRDYAGWARKHAKREERNHSQDAQSRRRRRTNKPVATPADWPTIEEFLVHDITTRAASGETFTVRDLGTLISTRPVLIALDGLDEVADLVEREAVSENAVKMNGRLQASATDLMVLVATRPGGTTPQLWSSSDFPRMDLLPLSHGLRVQYLRRWCEVAGIGENETAHLQQQFLSSQSLSHVKDLAAYPMQLAILLHLLYRRQLMPQQRTELYDEYFKTFLDREQAQLKEPLLATDRPLVVSVHAFLGWYIHTETETGRSSGAIKKADLKKQLRLYLSDRDNGRQLADKLHAAITTRMLCLVERQHDNFQFDVQTLREYFAAVYLFEEVERDKRDQCLIAMLKRPYWSNVLRFFVGKYSLGEVRGIKNLLQDLSDTPPLDRLPQLRATAAQLLADRAYHSHTTHPVRDIVDFIFDGPGVAFAEDGLLDSSNGHLVLSDGAGRAQAVAHLKDRLEQDQPSAMVRVLSKSLGRHVHADDDVEKWAWAAFDDDVTWFNVATQLRGFTEHLPGQDARIARAMTAFKSDDTWASILLAHGGWGRRDDAIVRSVVADVNDGAGEILVRTRYRSAPTSTALAVLAQRAQYGAAADRASSSSRTRARERTGARIFGKIESATADLGERPIKGTTREWAARFDAVAETWGDGWVLHRSVAAAHPDADLGSIAPQVKNEAARERVRRHHAMRNGRGEAADWDAEFEAATTGQARALLTIDLLTYAHVGVLTALSGPVNDVVGLLSPKHYSAVDAALQRGSRTLWGQLFIADAIRRNHARFSPRFLWLARTVASESSIEHIDKALADDVNASVADIAGIDMRAPIRHLAGSGKFKLATFKGRRPQLPVGGWASNIGTISLRKADYMSVLESPLDWPADLVHLAVQKASVDLQAGNKPLQQVSLDEEWIPVEP